MNGAGIDMASAVQKHTLAETLEMIRTQFSELRQTESLEFQVHEMVLVKRHRLEALMADYVECASAASAVADAPPVPGDAVPELVAELVVEEMALAPLPAMDAPKDLLQATDKPSAQFVLDSLNRLMSGLKGASAKQAAAA